MNLAKLIPSGLKGNANAVINGVILIVIVTALIPVAIVSITDANLSSTLTAILNTGVVFLAIGVIVVTARSMGMGK